MERKTSCKFTVKVLPIKRLNYVENSQYPLDFIYPDNPTWHENNVDNRFYSDPIITAMTGMMVRPAEKKMPLEHFKVLAITRGFTPTQWLSLAPKHKIRFQETFNALASLKMVNYNRADGADVEYNVARYLTAKNKLSPLVLATQLPPWPTPFHLSTQKHPKILMLINQLMSQYPQELKALKAQLNIKEMSLEKLK